MDWLQFVKEAGDGPFKAALIMVMIYGIRELSRIRKSMADLGVSMAVIVEKVRSHDKRITNLERKRR